jgi:hypothetical protein
MFINMGNFMNHLPKLVNFISINARILIFLVGSLLHIVGINTPPMS